MAGMYKGCLLGQVSPTKRPFLVCCYGGRTSCAASQGSTDEGGTACSAREVRWSGRVRQRGPASRTAHSRSLTLARLTHAHRGPASRTAHSRSLTLARLTHAHRGPASRTAHSRSITLPRLTHAQRGPASRTAHSRSERACISHGSLTLREGRHLARLTHPAQCRRLSTLLLLLPRQRRLRDSAAFRSLPTAHGLPPKRWPTPAPRHRTSTPPRMLSGTRTRQATKTEPLPRLNPVKKYSQIQGNI